MNFEWSFNPANYDPAGTFTIIPVGDYPAIITSVDVKATAAGDGGMLELERTITTGPMQGNKVIERLNLWNPNDQAKEIANRELTSICLVCNVNGFQSLADLQKLKGIPHQVVIGLQKFVEGRTKLNGDQTKEQWLAIGYTEVKGVKDASGNSPKKGQPYTGGGAPQGGAAPAGGGSPWGDNGGNAGGGATTTEQPTQTTQAPSGGTPWGSAGGGAAAPTNAAPWG